MLASSMGGQSPGLDAREKNMTFTGKEYMLLLQLLKGVLHP